MLPSNGSVLKMLVIIMISFLVIINEIFSGIINLNRFYFYMPNLLFTSQEEFKSKIKRNLPIFSLNTRVL